MKINKKLKEGIKKKIALISLTVLLLNTAMVGIFAPSGNMLRAVDLPYIDVEKQAISNECGTAEITLGITGAGDPIEERKPIDVVFVIDRSKSMAGVYLTNVKTAVKNFIDEMDFSIGDPDKVAVVSYAGYNSDPSQINYNLGSDENAAKNAVDELEASGGTCIECGLNTAYRMLNPGDREQFVILLSDGVANIKYPGTLFNSSYICNFGGDEMNCPTNVTECINNAITQGNSIKSLGVPIYSIGYKLNDINCDNGGQTRDLAIQTLKDISSGENDYYFDGEIDNIDTVFDDIAHEINNVAGYDAKIIEVLPAGINYTGMVSGQNPDSVLGQTITWEFGNLAIGESREVVFNVVTDGFLGYQGLIDVYPDTRAEYKDHEDILYLVPFPETNINIASCSAPEVGSITITKDSQPDSDQGFIFSVSGDLVDFTLVDDDTNPPTNSRSFPNIPVGSYTVTEELVSGWTLDDIVCTGDDGIDVDIVNREVIIDLDKGEDIECIFTNIEDGDNPINPGDVIINEIMQNPEESDLDFKGEWFELYNTTTDKTIDLEGCVISDNGTDLHVIMESLNIPPESYIFLARESDPAQNGGISPDYTYGSDITLGNGDDEIIIECGETVIDEVWYDGGPNFPDPTGASMILENFKPNHIGDNWCESSSPFGDGDFGTPGALNDPCDGIVCQANEISRECVSDGNAEITYEWNNSVCGNNYIDIEEDADCACVETEVAGECIDETNRQFTYTYNFDYCTVRDPETRVDETCEEEPIYQCSDGDDNDGDELIDAEDPGCWEDPEDSKSYNPEDNDEYHAYCGDGTCNGNETCSTCPQDCGSCGGGGGGGGGGVITKPTIIITNENVVYLGNGEALVTWTTNIETTRQVAYGDDSITVLGTVLEYGYDSVNGESSDMMKEHSVTISGLTDDVIYYFRPIADRAGSTGEKVGKEVSYVFEEEGDVLGVADPIVPEECNYLLEYIRLGAENNPVEVKKLETFLNEFNGESLAVNGIYEQVDFDAVSRFQVKYNENVLVPWSHEGSTGYVYITTKKMINELYCQREFPLTLEQAAEVSAFSSRFLSTFTGSGEAGDVEEGRVGGAETEEGETEEKEELTGLELEGEEGDSSQEIKIELEDEDEDMVVAASNYPHYFWIILALVILSLTYYFYNSRKTKQEEDVQ